MCEQLYVADKGLPSYWTVLAMHMCTSCLHHIVHPPCLAADLPGLERGLHDLDLLPDPLEAHGRAAPRIHDPSRPSERGSKLVAILPIRACTRVGGSLQRRDPSTAAIQPITPPHL